MLSVEVRQGTSAWLVGTRTRGHGALGIHQQQRSGRKAVAEAATFQPPKLLSRATFLNLQAKTRSRERKKSHQMFAVFFFWGAGGK